MATAQDIREFQQYLRQCTDAQVRGVYEKESEAYKATGNDDRDTYAALAEAEATHRGIEL